MYKYMIIAILSASLIFKLAFALFVIDGQNYFNLDNSAYLLSLDYYLGNEFYGDYIRTPLAPGYQLLPFLWLFGDIYGPAIWSALITVPALGALILLAHKWGLSGKRLITFTLFIAFEPIVSHLWVTGAVVYPAMALLFLGMYGFERHDKLGNYIMLATVPFISLFNLPTAIVAAIILSVMWLNHINKEQFKIGLLIIFLAIIVYIPFSAGHSPFDPKFNVPFKLLYTYPLYIIWWMWIPIAMATAFLVKRAYLKQEHISWLTFLIISMIMCWLLPTNEVIYNIPLRGVCIVTLLSYIIIAKYINWKIIIIPLILLMLSTPIIWHQGISMGHAPVKNLIEKHELHHPDVDLFIFERYLAFWGSYWWDKKIRYVPSPNGISPTLKPDADNFYCLLSRVNEPCATNTQYWLVNESPSDGVWHITKNITSAITREYNGYTGTDTIPPYFEKIDDLYIDEPFGKDDEYYVLYKIQYTERSTP